VFNKELLSISLKGGDQRGSLGGDERIIVKYFK
jgi:hypothetical protein